MFGSFGIFLFALLYTLVIGVFHLPQGIGASIVALLALNSLAASFRTGDDRRLPQALLLLTALCAIALGNVTNALTLTIGYHIVCAALLWLAAGHAAGGVVPTTLPEFLKAWALLLGKWRLGIHSAHGIPRTKLHINPMYFRGFLGALPVLIVFHVLLGRVNAEYASAMQEVQLAALSPKFWARALHTLGLYYLCATFLAVRINPGEFKAAPCLGSGAVTFALLSGATLLLLFDFFQLKLLGQRPLGWPFKEFSLYVQRGFWELIMVSLIGYGWWHFAARRGADLSTRVTKRLALCLFALLLLLLSGFALHKVVGLQLVYGLKDSRLFATAAVVLLGCTFLGSALRPQKSLFTGQLTGLLLVAGLAATLNIDSLVTRTHTVRVPNGEVMTKDYSYLLTNSYDNFLDWGEVMLQLLKEGAEPPKGYYWGDYLPLCIEDSRGIKRNLLKEHHQKLLAQVVEGRASTQGMLRLTLREENAVSWLRANQGLVEDVLKVVEQGCVPWGSSGSY